MSNSTFVPAVKASLIELGKPRVLLIGPPHASWWNTTSLVHIIQWGGKAVGGIGPGCVHYGAPVPKKWLNIHWVDRIVEQTGQEPMADRSVIEDWIDATLEYWNTRDDEDWIGRLCAENQYDMVILDRVPTPLMHVCYMRLRNAIERPVRYAFNGTSQHPGALIRYELDRDPHTFTTVHADDGFVGYRIVDYTPSPKLFTRPVTNISMEGLPDESANLNESVRGRPEVHARRAGQREAAPARVPQRDPENLP